MNLLDATSAEQVEPELEFPVVGIGASAGGLEAVTEMFHDTLGNTGIAFVLVLHLDPNHESLMAELLSRKTKLNVRQISDGDALMPDHLHVIPPGSSLRLEGGKLRLVEFEEPRGLRRPIDSFFVSLANTQGERAAAVVLSGTGADGSAGMRSIKEMGGICVAQSPEEARYDGMPFAALATELVDYTLQAHEIIGRLQSYFSGNYYPDLPDNGEDIERALSRILRAIREDLGHDFSGYKRATIFRRLERRLQILEYPSIDEYLIYLTKNETERRLLFQDFLINVTSFFRDTEAFEALREDVIVPLVEKTKTADEIRIWVPGCSSGQEAYSLAMLLDETCEAMNVRPLIQIFASDIDETVIQTARTGRYPSTSLSELPRHYQETYTVGQDGQFEIVPRIRDMVRFSIHSLIKDAPFSKIDLISCRNLMIYFDEKMQHDVLPIFHFSLRREGALFLGNSENVTRRGELFETIDSKFRLFRRRETGKRGHIILPLGSTSERGNNSINTTMSPERDFPRHERLDMTNATIYDHYAPPFVRVSLDGRIVDSSGDLSLFLMSRPGDERHLFSLAREGIRDSIMPLLADAQRENKRLALKDVEVHSPYGIQVADIIAHPIKDNTVALIFNAKERLTQQVEEYAVVPATRDERIAELQEDLQATRLMLKSKVEEIETTNEELKGSNEEMMSMNEELQSANEELTTANEELKNKIDELSIANADLDNFMQASELIMVVLDNSFRIRHLTQAAKRVLPLRDADRGRPISEFRIKFKGVDLTHELNRVFETSEAFEQSIQTEDNSKHYLMRIVPYFYGDGTVEGASITLVDLTELTGLRDDLHVKSERLRLALAAGRMGMAELDVFSGMVTIDQMLSEQFGLDGPGEVTMQDMTRNFDPQALEDMANAMKGAIEHNSGYEFDFRILLEEDERWMRTRGLPYRTQSGELKVVGPTIDITKERLDQDRLEMLVQEMSHRVKNLFAVIGSVISSAPKPSKDCEVFANAMLSRINALSYAYDLARKQGMLNGVNWIDLLNRVLTPHRNKQSVVIEGPDTFISSNILTTLTLLFHEIATNALKYGALSVPDGALNVAWSVEGDEALSLVWTETVPGFKAPEDETTGFGSKLVSMAVQQLHGTIEQEYTDVGILIRLHFKLF